VCTLAVSSIPTKGTVCLWEHTVALKGYPGSPVKVLHSKGTRQTGTCMAAPAAILGVVIPRVYLRWPCLVIPDRDTTSIS